MTGYHELSDVHTHFLVLKQSSKHFTLELLCQFNSLIQHININTSISMLRIEEFALDKVPLVNMGVT